MGNTYDYRSSATGWTYLLLPVEQIDIQQGTNHLKFDNILSDVQYGFMPIIRKRAEYSPVQKKIMYKINISIPLLFNDLSKMPSIENYFNTEVVDLIMYLSAKEISGVNEWRKFYFENLYMFLDVKKNNKSPLLTLNFNGIKENNLITTWFASEPA